MTFSLRRFFFPSVQDHVPDRYHLAAVTSSKELDFPDLLPLELRFVLARNPDRIHVFRAVLNQGYGIGIRTVDRTPEAVLQAIDRISRLTQENVIVPWLPRLLRDGEMPVFSEPELRNTEAQGVNLYEDARMIMARRFEYKKIVIVDLENQGVPESFRVSVREWNRDLYPFAVDYIVNRVIFDNAHTRTEVAQSIIKALLFVGPITHVLEHWMRGIGKLFAASADDLLSETAELFALRGSGFTWKQLARRSRLLVPVFILATWGAFSVEGYIVKNQLGIAGLLFGMSSIALSLTTAIQSVGMYRQAYKRLARMKKLPEQRPSISFLALRQDFTNPARLGLFVGACVAPVTAAAVFLSFPAWVHNGWILALLGSVESLVAGLTVFFAAKVNRLAFRQRILRLLRQPLDTQNFPRYTE